MANMNSAEDIPISKIQKNMEEAKQKRTPEQLASTIFAVLISTGSLNPVHRMHIRMFEHAKEFLQRNYADIVVVGGYLSPSHEHYVSSKLQSQYIESKHRAALCRFQTQDHPWIETSTWEMNQKQFENYPYVAHHHRQFLKEQFPSEKIQVMYLCGSDHAARCGLLKGIKYPSKTPVVCLARKDSYQSVKSSKQAATDGSFFLVENEDMDVEVSSTLVRKKIAAKESIAEYVGEMAEQYITQHHILGA